jgi:hypothetical protein
MPDLGEAGTRDQPDVSGADDGDVEPLRFEWQT